MTRTFLDDFNYVRNLESGLSMMNNNGNYFQPFPVPLRAQGGDLNILYWERLRNSSTKSDALVTWVIFFSLLLLYLLSWSILLFPLFLMYILLFSSFGPCDFFSLLFGSSISYSSLSSLRCCALFSFASCVLGLLRLFTVERALHVRPGIQRGTDPTSSQHCDTPHALELPKSLLRRSFFYTCFGVAEVS